MKKVKIGDRVSKLTIQLPTQQVAPQRSDQLISS